MGVKSLGPLVILAIPLLMLFWLSSRTKRQQRELAAVSASLTVGQRVMTSSGLHGVVSALTDEDVDLTVAPGVVTRWDRRAIIRSLDPQDSAPVVDVTSGAHDTPEPASARSNSEPAADPDPPGHA